MRLINDYDEIEASLIVNGTYDKVMFVYEYLDDIFVAMCDEF